MEKGFTLVEIIISISFILIIATISLILVFKNNNNENILEVAQNIMLDSGRVFEETDETLKLQVADLNEDESVCISVDTLYKKGFIKDSNYEALKDKNIYYKVISESEFPGEIVFSNEDCVLYDENYVSKIRLNLEVFSNNVDNINNKLEELKEDLEINNYKLNLNLKNYETNTTKSYNYSGYNSYQASTNYSFVGSIGNYIFFTKSGNIGGGGFYKYNVINNVYSTTINIEGTEKTPNFAASYASYYAFSSVSGGARTASTFSDFNTQDYKSLIYESYASGETRTCNLSGEYTLTNAGIYGHYYLEYYKCGIQNNDNNNFACKLDGRNKIYVGALRDACIDYRYETPRYEKIETEGNPYGSATNALSLNYVDENVLNYYYGTNAIPSTVLTKLDSLDNINAYYGFSNNCTWSAKNCTVAKRLSYIFDSGKAYYIDEANNRWGVLFKDTYDDVYFRVVWVKESSVTKHLVNNYDSSYKCIADTSGLTASNVDINDSECTKMDLTSVNIDDIKNEILN